MGAPTDTIPQIAKGDILPLFPSPEPLYHLFAVPLNQTPCFTPETPRPMDPLSGGVFLMPVKR
jgi:hypothetical protein